MQGKIYPDPAIRFRPFGWRIPGFRDIRSKRKSRGSSQELRIVLLAGYVLSGVCPPLARRCPHC